MLHKKGMVNSGFVGHDFIGAFLVNGEFLDEFENETRLFWFCRTDSELRVHGIVVHLRLTMGPSTLRQAQCSGTRNGSFFQHFASEMLQRSRQHLGFHHLKRGVELFQQLGIVDALCVS